jgi:hypothetical protein
MRALTDRSGRQRECSLPAVRRVPALPRGLRDYQAR